MRILGGSCDLDVFPDAEVGHFVWQIVYIFQLDAGKSLKHVVHHLCKCHI